MIRFLNKILVSTPVMGTDATFDKSVILIYEESLQHVAGVILNKPNITTVHEVFRIKGFKTTDFRKDKLFMGGPVNHDHVMLLHSEEWKSNNTMRLGNGHSITSDHIMMDKFYLGDRPKNWRMICGISLWTPDQLEMEIKRKYWMILDNASKDLILEPKWARQWQQAVDQVSQQTIDKFFN
jgi:putative AlgH/UPF0301 family transcriptional regulator